MDVSAQCDDTSQTAFQVVRHFPQQSDETCTPQCDRPINDSPLLDRAIPMHNSRQFISRIPVELLVEFFSLALTSERDVVDRSAIRVAAANRVYLMLVCKRWRDLVVTNGSLWTTLSFRCSPDGTSGFSAHIHSFLMSQALRYAICIRHLELRHTTPSSTDATLERLSARGFSCIETLCASSITPPENARLVQMGGDALQFPALRNIMLVNVDAPLCLVSSRTRRLEVVFDRDTDYHPEIGPLLQVLERATSLESLTLFHYLPVGVETERNFNSRTVHWEHIREVCLAGDAEGFEDFVDFLNIDLDKTSLRVFAHGTDEHKLSRIAHGVNTFIDDDTCPLLFLEAEFTGEDGCDSIVLRGRRFDLDGHCPLEIHLTPANFRVFMSRLLLDEVHILRIIAQKDLASYNWKALRAAWSEPLWVLSVSFTPGCLLDLFADGDFEHIGHLFIEPVNRPSSSDAEDTSSLVQDLVYSLEQCDDIYLRQLHLHGFTLTDEEKDSLETLVEICFDPHCTILEETLEECRCDPESRNLP